jgi:hypothetical protein
MFFFRPKGGDRVDERVMSTTHCFQLDTHYTKTAIFEIPHHFKKHPHATPNVVMQVTFRDLSCLVLQTPARSTSKGVDGSEEFGSTLRR